MIYEDICVFLKKQIPRFRGNVNLVRIKKVKNLYIVFFGDQNISIITPNCTYCLRIYLKSHHTYDQAEVIRFQTTSGKEINILSKDVDFRLIFHEEFFVILKKMFCDFNQENS